MGKVQLFSIFWPEVPRPLPAAPPGYPHLSQLRTQKSNREQSAFLGSWGVLGRNTVGRVREPTPKGPHTLGVGRKSREQGKGANRKSEPPHPQ